MQILECPRALRKKVFKDEDKGLAISYTVKTQCCFR